MKNILSVFMCLSIVISTFVFVSMPASAEMSNSGSCGANVKYTFNSSTGLLTISGSGDMENYYYSNDNTNSPFFNNSSIKSIVIEKGVTSVGNYAFYNCGALTSVSIGNSVKNIGIMTFGQCNLLISVTIGDSVKTIEQWAFGYCNSLTRITIPNGVTSIEQWAFGYCSSLAKITIPNSVTSIGSNVFFNCSLLASITIGDSVKSIGGSAFYNCSSLESVSIGNSVTSICSSLFYNCSSLKSITISNSVTSIDTSAFGYCSSLASIAIPNSVTSIGIGAFFGCSSLASITVDSNNEKYDNRDNCNAIIESSTNKLLVGCKNTIIPNSVTSIGVEAFTGCSSLESITIPESVTNIGVGAFENCSSLSKANYTGTIDQWCEIRFSDSFSNPMYYSKSLYINDNLVSNITKIKSTKINSYAFENCNALTNIVIFDGVTSIGDYAFSGCNSLTRVILPKSVINIGNSAFSGCCCLTNVNYKGNAIDWNRISIGTNNEYLTSANTTYNFVCTHNYNETVKKQPTCTEQGISEYSCSICGNTYIGKTHAFGHKLVLKNAKKATCFKIGYTGDKVCSVCGKKITKGKTISKIKLKRPNVKYSARRNSFKIKYKKVSGAIGFQVKYKIGKKTVTKTFKTKKSSTKTIKKLKKGKCKVKIRAFVKSGKIIAYSNWTKAKVIKIK